MLPKLSRPEYSTTLPSNGKKIKYHPFTVKEEKILMLAAEGGDNDEISNAVTNCLNNCISSPNDLAVEDMALFDVEYVFLKARSKSVGETIQIRVTDPDDETCTLDHEINIDKIGVKKFEEHTQLVRLADGVSVQMRYPGIEFFNTGINLTNMQSTIDAITMCIDQIIVEDEVYNKEDMSEDEIREWVEGLSSKQFQEVNKFFSTMPRLTHTITLKNPKTKKNFSITLEGLADFF